MASRWIGILGAGLGVMAAAAHAPAEESRVRSYPASRVEAVEETLHGRKVPDPYRWLEDAKSPDVQEWMTSQHAFARAHLDQLPGRSGLVSRLRALLYYDSVSPPLHRGTRYFYTRRHADREKPIVYWKEGEQGEERVLLDPNRLSADGSVALGVWVPSWDGRRLAYALRPNNADEATLYVMEVETGKVSPTDVIEGARYATPRWNPEGDGFYYIWLPTDRTIPVDRRPGYSEARFHRLGTDPKSDPVLRERTNNPQTFQGISASRDGRFLFSTIAHGWNATDYFFRDLKRGDQEWRPLVVGVPALFDVTAWKEHFYVLTNDGAPRYRVFRVNPGKPDRSNWKEIIPEAKDAVLDGMSVVGNHLVLSVLRNATSLVEVHSLDGKLLRTVETPGLGSAGAMVGNPDEDEAYFSFASFTQPPQVYKTSVRRGQTSLWSAVKVPVDPSRFTVSQVWYPSADGTRISMFLVHRKDLKRDGSTPFVLGGYGGFNVSMTPGFSGSLYPWLEAGGGYALPNLRGGGEYGEEWHKAGMLHKKQNVFDDFIAAAEYLVKEGYTKPERLGIRGGSNGGLLVGAAMTQRPELFRAVICAVPLLDMVRYHLFGSGRTWIPEYGSAEDPAQFQTLFTYSPYHRVRPGTRYPALLMQSADSDDRVDPMHARKMVARVQAATSPDRPVLLDIEKNAGHGGGGLVRQAIEQAADSYAFLMRELGLKPVEGGAVKDAG